jgi:hypothetical protein
VAALGALQAQVRGADELALNYGCASTVEHLRNLWLIGGTNPGLTGRPRPSRDGAAGRCPSRRAPIARLVGDLPADGHLDPGRADLAAAAAAVTAAADKVQGLIATVIAQS